MACQRAHRTAVPDLHVAVPRAPRGARAVTAERHLRTTAPRCFTARDRRPGMAVPNLHAVDENRQNPAAIRIGGQRQDTARARFPDAASPGGGVPSQHFPPVRRSKKLPGAGLECDCTDLAQGAAGQRRDWFARIGSHHPNRAVAATVRQMLAVRTEGHALHLAFDRERGRCRGLPAGVQVPQADRAIRRGGCQCPAVRRERCRRHFAGVPPQRRQRPKPGGVPDLKQTVLRSGNQAASIHAETDHRHGRRTGPHLRGDLCCSRAEAKNQQLAVAQPGGDSQVVRGERRALHFAVRGAQAGDQLARNRIQDVEHLAIAIGPRRDPVALAAERENFANSPIDSGTNA